MLMLHWLVMGEYGASVICTSVFARCNEWEASVVPEPELDNVTRLSSRCMAEAKRGFTVREGLKRSQDVFMRNINTCSKRNYMKILNNSSE